MYKSIITTATLLLILMTLPVVGHANDEEWFDSLEESFDSTEKGGKSVTDRFVLAPMPMANPTLGVGLVGVGMYMHPEDDFWNDEPRTDNATRQSITGLAAMYTSNESWATGVFHKGFYDDDRYRSSAYLAYGELNLKFYGIGDDSFLRDHSIAYTAAVTAFQPQFFFRITDNWYIGPKYTIVNWQLGINLSDLHPVLPDLKHSITTAGAGLAGEWDTTDHSVFATTGGKFEFSAIDYGPNWGGKRDYAKASMNYNHYFPLAEKWLLAARYDLNLSSGNTPFFDMPSLHLRGFPYAKYIDKQASSIQGEVKYQLSKKWSTTVFGGLGWIGSTPDELYREPVIPTGGFGLRYLLSEKEKMNIGMDIAFGPESEAIYFRVGEWF